MVPGEIRAAIEAACRKEGQSASVAQLISAWFEQVASGNESLTDVRSWERRIALLLKAVEVAEVDEE